MPLGSQSTPEAIRADLERAHHGVFGARADQDLSAHLDGTAQAVALIAGRTLDAYAAEPDFVTGSSEKERSA